MALTASLGQANAADPTTGATKENDRATADRQGKTPPSSTSPGTIARPKGRVGGCTVSQLQNPDPVVGAGIDACLNQTTNDLINGNQLHFVSCSGTKMECCQRQKRTMVICKSIGLTAADSSTTKAPASGAVMTK